MNAPVKLLSLLITISLYSCANEHANKQTVLTVNTPASVGIKSNYFLSASQNCRYDSLSPDFILELFYQYYVDTIETRDSPIIHLTVKDRVTNTVLDSFQVPAGYYYFSGAFTSCNTAVSYATGYNVNPEPVDNYFGDIVVADLNFDGKEDIAVMSDGGGNSGPLYSYYMQAGGRKFLLDTFLTNRMQFFPTRIDRSRNRLITYGHAGVCHVGEHIYKYSNSSWRRISHKQINICDENPK